MYRGPPEQATTANSQLAGNRPLRQDTRATEGFTTWQPDIHSAPPAFANGFAAGSPACVPRRHFGEQTCCSERLSS